LTQARACAEGPTFRALAVAWAVVAIIAGSSSLCAAAGPSAVPSLSSPQERRHLPQDLPLDLPLTIDADRMEYLEQEHRYVGDGSAVLTYGALRLTADHLSYREQTGQLEATGHVLLLQGAQRMAMERLEYNLFDQTGVMSHVEMMVPIHKGNRLLEESPYRLIARRLERRADGSLHAEGAAFTTCDTVCERGAPPWQFEAHRLRAVLDGYLVASGVTLRVKGTRVLYLPWVIYPLRERQSGLLIPTVGFNSSEGFRYLQPLYWAIGRSQDATVSLDLRTSLGIGVDSEYRYRLTETAKGQLNLDYFHDWDNGANFLTYRAQHQQQWLNNRLQLQWDINVVNRKDLFTELTFNTQARSQLGLDSIGSLTYRLDHQFMYLAMHYTQNLVTSTQPSLQKLPEIGYRLVEARLGTLPLYANMQATVVHFYEGSDFRVFTNESGNGELRVDLYPTLTGRFDPVAGLVVTPTAGVRETYYRSTSLVPDGTVYRQAVYAALRTDTRLTRHYGAVTHLVEPALLFEYSHQLNSVTVPQFDEVDTIPEKRHVTLMLTNRLRRPGEAPDVPPATAAAGSDGAMHDASGQGASGRAGRGDLVWIKLTESYALHQVNSQSPDQSPFTDLRIQAEARPWSALAVMMESFVNFYGEGVTVMNSGLRATPADWLVLTAGEHFTHHGEVPRRGDLVSPETSILSDPIGGGQRIAAVNWGGEVSLPGRVSLATRSLYDVEHAQFTEMSYGIRWRGACNECWSATLVYQQLAGRGQIFFLITLRGLSSAGSDAVKELFPQ
jgi:LPS-assembly protein